MNKKSNKNTGKEASQLITPLYTGVGNFISVLYVLDAFKKSSGKKPPTGGSIWN